MGSRDSYQSKHFPLIQTLSNPNISKDTLKNNLCTKASNRFSRSFNPKQHLRLIWNIYIFRQHSLIGNPLINKIRNNQANP